jgi:hypothetical protein
MKSNRPAKSNANQDTNKLINDKAIWTPLEQSYFLGLWFSGMGEHRIGELIGRSAETVKNRAWKYASGRMIYAHSPIDGLRDIRTSQPWNKRDQRAYKSFLAGNKKRFTGEWEGEQLPLSYLASVLGRTEDDVKKNTIPFDRGKGLGVF